MELDYVTSDLLEDGAVEVGDADDVLDVEGERCGICMDVIIDRGVLDCCQHWFCFECIDNWATITNLCPLCQTEFQLITCISVYDATGSNKIDEDSLSREIEWCDEGKGDSLSSPSYYIDENAVICLDGDGCKIRNGSTSIEEDSYLDTSIACDSCDVWYHAACVHFDPEATSDDTWLCPRCRSDVMPHQSDSLSNEKNWCVPENAINEQKVEAGFAGKVEVSVADDGETALVVSMVGSSTWTAESNETSLAMVQVPCNESGSELNNHKSIQEGEKMKLPLSYNMSLAQPSDFKSFLLDDFRSSNADQVTSDVQERNLSEEAVPEVVKADKSSTDVNLGANKFTGLKRKNSDCSIGEVEVRNANVALEKRSKTEGKLLRTSPVKQSPKGEDATCDILSIVKGTGHKRRKRFVEQNHSDKSSIGDNVAGLRVKKIMRGSADARESAVAVEKLRKEIREAVRNKSTKDIGENLFDPKLLAAFRAAIVGPKTKHPRKLTPLALKAKKSMLQKGKVRENLTKKIYGDSNGKRRNAWARECEIEFWKHRCVGAKKPEKIDTLKSVLSLLRRDPEDLETKQSPEIHGSNPVLSRLYLADTSVFPRKNDITPLSVSTTVGNSEQKAQQNSSLVGNDVTEMNKVSLKVGDTKGPNCKVTGTKGVTAFGKVQTNRCQGPSASASTNSKAHFQKATVTMSNDQKKDKRTWALEVLARKKALATNHASREKEEDLAELKGNYPLLAQLPADMRPVLATSRHNKIPISIRQAQLYRLTEHLLKIADLPVIQRTAATELAVADAINIEKEIVDKSNSKVVYLNLCSQEILHHSNNKTPSRTTQPSSSLHPGGPSDRLEQNTDEFSEEDPSVIEALRTAGLLSDSPPNSPIQRIDVLGEDNNSLTKTSDEGPDNVLEIDSHQDMDIYGDFEYDLEDQDYIGVSNANARKPPADECVSKVNVVFSTLNSDKSPADLNISVSVRPEGFPSLSKIHANNTDAEIRSLAIDGGDDKTSVFLDSLPDENGELSLAECEELYGPDREPLMNNSQLEASKKLVGSQHEVPGANPSPERNEDTDVPDQPVKAPDSGSESNVHGEIIASNFENSSNENRQKKGKTANAPDEHHGGSNSVLKKVEAYIKEHVRPLCKSGVITAEQYKWAVAKTAEKVMKYHSSAKNANFLIKEGEKVKKLAEQYVESAQQKREK